jgi:microcin C transport system substrate-binding protein
LPASKPFRVAAGRCRVLTLLGLGAAVVLAPPAAAQDGQAAGDTTISHAIAEFGEPKYGPDFAHFDYADPDAPVGGSIVLTGARPSFDSLNTIPIQGEWATNVGLAKAPLMAGSQDELSSAYGVLVETVEVPDDEAWMTLTLREEAVWADGVPVTAEDVAWTFNQVTEIGRPFLRSFFDDVTGVEVLDDRRVKFSFATTETMQPLIRVATVLPVEPKHWWTEEGADRDIGGSTLEAPPWAGPYEIVDVDPGRSIAYRRRGDWWGWDLPSYAGQFNFDEVRYDYYRDPTVQFEAFRAGEYDFRREFTSRQWATGYDFDAVEDGLIQRREVEEISYAGIYGFFLNTRDPLFEDQAARQALNHLYPFEWVQQNIMFGYYERVDSYFPGSEYAADGAPEGREREILEEYRGRVPDALFEGTVALPENPQSRVSRENRRAALRLLAEAGFEVRDGQMVDVETGEPYRFEILLRSPALEPHTQAWVRNLEQVGIEAQIRVVDSAQYQLLMNEFRYQATPVSFTFFPPPGPELRNRFSCATVDAQGSANYLGVCDPVVDELADRIIAAETLDEKEVLTRVLDRVLMAGWYVVPAWYNEVAWVAFWDMFDWPEEAGPLNDFGLPNSIRFQPTWWYDADKAAALAEAR